MNTNGQRYAATAGQRGPTSLIQGKRVLNGNGGSASNNETPVIQKRWSQSGVNGTSGNANIGKTPKSRRPALGEVSNTVKSRGGNGAGAGGIKAKPTLSMTPLSSQSQPRSSISAGLSAKSVLVTKTPLSLGNKNKLSSSSSVGLKTGISSSSVSSTSSDLSSPLELDSPNLSTFMDPAEEIREVKEMPDIRGAPRKGSYSGAPVIETEGEYEEGDENYPEVEQMGHSDLYDARPMGLFDSIPLALIPEDPTEYEWPDFENLAITPAEEIELSHSDLSESTSDIDEEKVPSSGSVAGPENK